MSRMTADPCATVNHRRDSCTVQDTKSVKKANCHIKHVFGEVPFEQLGRSFLFYPGVDPDIQHSDAFNLPAKLAWFGFIPKDPL